MKLIPLSKRGKHKGKYFAQVDDDLYDYLNQWNWNVSIKPKTCYVQRNENHNGKHSTIMMHRVVMGITDPLMEVDHEDHNGLNNQTYNLRVATKVQNRQNKSKKSGGKSRYIGVDTRIWVGRRKGNLGKKTISYRAKISEVRLGKKTEITIGTFKSEKEAAMAYDKKAKELRGKFANLNFPD